MPHDPTQRYAPVRSTRAFYSQMEHNHKHNHNDSNINLANTNTIRYTMREYNTDLPTTKLAMLVVKGSLELTANSATSTRTRAVIQGVKRGIEQPEDDRDDDCLTKGTVAWWVNTGDFRPTCQEDIHLFV